MSMMSLVDTDTDDDDNNCKIGVVPLTLENIPGDLL